MLCIFIREPRPPILPDFPEKKPHPIFIGTFFLAY
jgi:hypothetical protein